MWRRKRRGGAPAAGARSRASPLRHSGCLVLGCVVVRVCRASICVNAVKLMLLLTDKIYSFVFDHTDASVTPRTPPAPHGSRQRATSSHLEPPHASTAPPATDVTRRASHSTRPCATTRLPPPPPPLLPAGRRLPSSTASHFLKPGLAPKLPGLALLLPGLALLLLPGLALLLLPGLALLLLPGLALLLLLGLAPALGGGAAASLAFFALAFRRASSESSESDSDAE